MSQLHRRPLLLLLPLLLSAVSCDDGGTTETGAEVGDGGTTGDAGTGVDGGPTPPPPGRLRLEVAGAAWSSETLPGRDVLYVRVRLANGTATSAELAPPLFTLSTAGGADVLGVAASFAPDTICAADLAVSVGATLTCFVAFGVPAGDLPRRVDYRAPDGREASADVPTCDAGESDALCPSGLVCTSSGCVARCSPGAPTGFCSDPDQQCVAGACVGPCAFDRPEGYCVEGRCVDGTCVTGCREVRTESSCLSCVFEAYESCPTVSCLNAESCVNCVTFADTCSCASECDGCEGEIDSTLDCVADRCPGCVE
jgi:hypothetical protein